MTCFSWTLVGLTLLLVIPASSGATLQDDGTNPGPHPPRST